MSCLADAEDGTDSSQHRLLFDLTNNATLEFLESLYTFKTFYGRFHRYISFALCLAGILANIVHICVLTRPEMRRSSVHTTLTCIAIADIGTMSSYLMYITRFEFFMDASGYNLEWAEFLRMHAVISIALHAVSLYLVVFMAFIRLMALDVGQSKWMMPRRACGICMLIALLVFICCIPTFLAHEIYERLDNNNTVEKLYSIGFSSVFLNDGCALLKFNLWLTGSVLKAAPCFLLVVLTFALLKRLRGNEKKRRERFFKLVEKTNSVIKQTQSTASARRCAAADRTTYVLLLMLCVFLLTELPQGLFAILNAMYTYQFHSYVYMSIADVLDLLSLINCYVAFTVYMLTSSTYRETLLSIFVTISTRKKYGSVYLRNNNHTPLVNRLSSRQKAENNKKPEENNEEKLALNNGFA